MAIFGDFTLEDTRIIFEQNSRDNTVNFRVYEYAPNGKTVSESFRDIPQDKFLRHWQLPSIMTECPMQFLIIPMPKALWVIFVGFPKLPGRKYMFRILSFMVAVMLSLSACSPADVASSNLSEAADNFEINRRVIFYNGITGGYMLSIEGLCSLGNQDTSGKLSVTCKTGPDTYKKHFLGLSDNVTFFVEQMEPMKVGTYRYRVNFNPTTIIPDITPTNN